MNSYTTFCYKKYRKEIRMFLSKARASLNKLGSQLTTWVMWMVKMKTETLRWQYGHPGEGLWKKTGESCKKYSWQKEQDAATDGMYKKKREKRRQWEESKLIQASRYESQRMELPGDKETQNRICCGVKVAAIGSGCSPICFIKEREDGVWLNRQTERGSQRAIKVLSCKPLPNLFGTAFEFWF